MKNFLLPLAGILLLSSCYSSRKAKINEEINNTVAQQQKEIAAIDSLSLKKQVTLSEGKIDSVIDTRINSSLDQSKSRIDSVKKIIEEITTSSTDRKTLRKSYKKIIRSKLVYLKSDRTFFDKRIVNYGLIREVLSNAKQTQFDLATFFGPGEFMVPAEKVEQAKAAFSPIIDSLLKFASRFPDVAKNSTIVLKGYADATGIKSGTPLYYRLVNELKQNSATTEELNLAISKLRAEAISEIVNKVIQKKQPEFLQYLVVHIEIVQEGRGQEKPNPKITDYTDDDSRRRIVLFFWSILPVGV